MSATDTQSAATHDGHPEPRDYVRIALILGALTALEVSVIFVDFGAVAVPLLIVLMVIKFVIVASWFMHLKFDTKVYGRMLYGGLFLALLLYMGTLAALILDPFRSFTT